MSTCKILKDAELDKISCLPGDVIDRILSYLPIKEAVRTSVLSSKWSNIWYTLPNLVFDEHCVSIASFQYPSFINDKFQRIVDHVLLLHNGPINKFEINDRYCNLVGPSQRTDIDRWILHLIGMSIKELVLDINHLCMNESYKIPWRLFSCQSLQRLKLNFCCLKPPMTFKGFRNLKSLDLYNVKMTQDDFEKLISSSPLLEKLKLTHDNGFEQINIHGPNLKVFNFFGDFEDISFDNTFKLSELSVLLLPRDSIQGRLCGCSSNLLRFFVHLPNIQNLAIHQHTLKYLATGVVPTKLPTPCINLRSLCVCINFADRKEITAALCLLKSSPKLEKLEILVERQTDLLTPASCSENIFSEPKMPFQVRHVRIYGISGFESELNFIRFLLLYSPVLKKMSVGTRYLNGIKPKFMTELIQFKRASEQAEVIYEV